jgi:hemoglobin
MPTFKSGLLAFAAGLLLLGAPACSSPAKYEKTSKTSLYDRLGGSYAIAAVTDDFVNRLLADPVVTGNKEAVKRLPQGHVPGLKFEVAALLCQVTGGPAMYTGKSMKDAHMGMHITDAEWNAMVADFKATLNAFKVPAQEQQELFDIVGSTKADIVGQ